MDLDAAPEAQENFRLKIVFIRHREDITADRVVNIDQTSVRILPTSTRGWKPKGSGSNSRWAVDTKRVVTAVLAVFMEREDIFPQLIYIGKTKAVLLTGPVPDIMTLTYTENHWSTTDSMLELVLSGLQDQRSC